jgi:hypothetical protein
MNPLSIYAGSDSSPAERRSGVNREDSGDRGGHCVPLAAAGGGMT